ncbi:MAG TPA: HD-GYP domain-containing protein [Gemmatimonadales bacterium]|nr:HD-GYP domain-containing protein [Gemmatimonadales bacterium]HRZ08250.1 HD-GYP domain-containing protein [Gemmatimonadales bacterium]
MRSVTKTSAYIALVAFIALALGFDAFQYRQPSPGIWPLLSFIFMAFLVEQSSTQLKVGARGSTSFVMHMSAGLLFGGFWAGVIALSSSVMGQLALGSRPEKLIFNGSQRAASVMFAVLIYHLLGGGLPPAYLQVVGSVESTALQRDFFLFFAYAATYFILNSVAVSGVVALTTERSFRDVWSLNTRGVIGYDLGASAIALLLAWLYTWFQATWELGSIGLVLVVIPIVAVRHVYGLYHQLQESGQELLQVMVKAIEARDPYTSGHSLRVSQLSRLIALEMGLQIRDVEQVHTAALLHDVGKIHEEFAPLLRKEDRLTPDETALMQTHSARSAELVGIISKFRGFIQDSVRHHHERWDGKGYPNGLSGHEIPLASRVILVADTIDAMTTDRPYRKRLPLEVVIAELKKCAGSQFDPEVVEHVVASVAVRRLITVGVETSPMPVTMVVSDPGASRSGWAKKSFWKGRTG